MIKPEKRWALDASNQILCADEHYRSHHTARYPLLPYKQQLLLCETGQQRPGLRQDLKPKNSR